MINEADSHPVRVLLVEDEDTIRGVLARVLRRDGFEVAQASSAEDALAQFHREPFPLVVTDIVMGGMTGLELLKEIRRLDDETVTLVMTSHASFETAREALRIGAYDFLTKPFEDLSDVSTVVRRAAEKVVLQRRNIQLVEKLAQHATKLESLNTELKVLAIRDGMTGLFNHRHFRSVLEGELERCGRHRRIFSLLFIDVDHFKRFNDREGHLAGDQVLCSIGTLLVEHSRKTSVVARYGGEEFVILLPESNAEGARVCAESLRAIAEATLPVTLSIGVAGYPEHGNEPDEILDRADNALYAAKANGRNRVELFEPSEETVGA